MMVLTPSKFTSIVRVCIQRAGTLLDSIASHVPMPFVVEIELDSLP